MNFYMCNSVIHHGKCAVNADTKTLIWWQTYIFNKMETKCLRERWNSASLLWFLRTDIIYLILSYDWRKKKKSLDFVSWLIIICWNTGIPLHKFLLSKPQKDHKMYLMLHYSMLNYTTYDNAAQSCFSNCTFWNVTSTSNSCIKHLASFCYDELLKNI